MFVLPHLGQATPSVQRVSTNIFSTAYSSEKRRTASTRVRPFLKCLPGALAAPSGFPPRIGVSGNVLWRLNVFFRRPKKVSKVSEVPAKRLCTDYFRPTILSKVLGSRATGRSYTGQLSDWGCRAGVRERAGRWGCGASGGGVKCMQGVRGRATQRFRSGVSHADNQTQLFQRWPIR